MMQRRFYTKLVEMVGNHKGFWTAVVWLCRLPWVFLAAYAVTLAYLLATLDLKWIFFLIIPAATVLLVTLLRNALNRPRPFERFAYEPLIKHGTGKSFPSRHTACAVIIGMACLYVNLLYGIVMLVLSAVVGVSRILAGVHHIVDVVAGAAISVACGLLGFVLLAPLFGL